MSATPAAPDPASSPGADGRPLAGRRLVVTRAVTEAARLTGRLRSLGAEVVEVPLIATAPPADEGRALGAAITDAVSGAVAWLIVTSPTGARCLVAELGGRRLLAQVCAVGPGTAEVLEAAGVVVALVPERHVGEGLVEAFPPAPRSPDDGRTMRVVVARAAVARDVVPDALAARGWEVQVAEAYRTVPAEVTPAGLAALAAADAVTVTSSSTADALADLVAARAGFVAPPVVCMGPVAAATASTRGLVCLATAEPHSLDGLVDAVVAALGHRPTRSVPGEGGSGAGP